MKVNTILLTVFFGIISVLLIFSYSRYSQKITISYWDEYLWVGESYFTQFFLQGNHSKDIWESYHSFDQPMLARYMYGLWLYPKFLDEKDQQKTNLDFTRFLIANGFYLVDTNLPQYHAYYRKNGQNQVRLNETDEGNYQYYLNKYGTNVIKILDLITYARKVNFVLLTMAVLVPALFFYHQRGLIFSLLFILFYGFNSLMIVSGIRAHSEGLFILLFNTALIMLFYLFLYRQKMGYLLFFSIFTGLAMSTKLNALMLYLIYLFLFFVLNSGQKYSLNLVFQKILAPFFLIFMVFIILNPYTYSNPLLKTFNLFKYRAQHTTYLSGYFPQSSIPSPLHSLAKTFTNFYSHKNISNFNKPVFLPNFKYLGIFTLLIFVVGLYSEIKMAQKKNPLSLITLGTFFCAVLITSFYLRLNWDRYFVHLVIFFIYYQISGLIHVSKGINLLAKK